MTIAEALADGTLRLTKSSSPRLDAEVLLAQLLNRDRTYLISHDTDVLLPQLQRQFAALVAQRRRGIPIAYLTGHKEFFGLDFIINKHVLIPRPETEELVEQVLALIKQSNATTIADIGTGSGAIAVTIKKQLPNIITYATESSQKALPVARQNARRHKTNIIFKHGDLLVPLKKQRLDLIIANLPYLDPRWITQRELTFEPQRALAAGTGGLVTIKRFLKQLTAYQPQATALLEIDPRQKQKLRRVLGQLASGHTALFRDDHSGHTRFVLLAPVNR